MPAHSGGSRAVGLADPSPCREGDVGAVAGSCKSWPMSPIPAALGVGVAPVPSLGLSSDPRYPHETLYKASLPPPIPFQGPWPWPHQGSMPSCKAWPGQGAPGLYASEPQLHPGAAGACRQTAPLGEGAPGWGRAHSASVHPAVRVSHIVSHRLWTVVP